MVKRDRLGPGSPWHCLVLQVTDAAGPSNVVQQPSMQPTRQFYPPPPSYHPTTSRDHSPMTSLTASAMVTGFNVLDIRSPYDITTSNNGCSAKGQG
eukprot:44874-Eustigmatos_ZCMA.PRE.1